MRRVAAPLLVVLLATGLPAAGATPVAQGPSPAGQMLADYQAGVARQAVFEKTVPTEAAYRLIRGDLFQRIRALREQGEPVGTIFLLDLSIWAVDRGWADGPSLVRTAQDILLQRPERPGASVERDRIEILYHRSALAMLTLRKQFSEAEAYLDRIEGRIYSAADPRGTGRLVDTRLPLARARLLEAQTAPGEPSGDNDVGLLIPDPGDRGMRQQLERVLTALDAAGLHEETAAEAAVRQALVLVRLGRPQQALTAVERSGKNADAAQRYWAELFRGRALEALNRPADAASAYEAALRVAPGAQTPLIALASLFHRQGELDRANEWATQARASSGAEPDPWWQYWLGEVRFVSAWLAELRVAHP
jgi:tetratricopeptide (TPR) repeat protein